MKFASPFSSSIWAGIDKVVPVSSANLGERTSWTSSVFERILAGIIKITLQFQNFDWQKSGRQLLRMLAKRKVKIHLKQSFWIHMRSIFVKQPPIAGFLGY